MKILLHPATTAFGAAFLLLLILLAPLASSSHTEIFHLSGSAWDIFLPVLADFLLVWLGLTVLLSASRHRPLLGRAVWIALLLILPQMVLKDRYALADAAPGPAVRHAALAFALVEALLLVLLLRGRDKLPVFYRIVRVSAILLGFAAASGAVTVAQVVWFAWEARGLNAAEPHHVRTAISVKPRIIWLVLDELSYDQIYGHRMPGLELPEFDRLAATSTVFSQVRPAGVATEVVLPALMSGLPLAKVKSPADGRNLLVREVGTSDWKTFDPHDTVFQDAIGKGYGTAVAGWFNPYCRILGNVLDNCHWASHIPLPGGMFAGQSFEENAGEPALHHLRPLLAMLGDTKALAQETRFHQQDYENLYREADQLLEDPTATFMLLHMPVPHPGGIYSRRTNSFSDGPTSYFDNLALADRYVGHLRHVLEARGEWDSTTLVIMGDHSWRVWMWDQQPGWTPEEQKGSRSGKFDDRPMYLVKTAHQSSGEQVTTPFAALETRALFDALFSGTISNAEQLQAWAKDHAAS